MSKYFGLSGPGYYWIKVSHDSEWTPAEYNPTIMEEPVWFTPGWEVPYREGQLYVIGPKLAPPE